MAPYRLGVDFGTVTTSVAIAKEGEDPTILEFDGRPTIPTALFFNPGGGFEFGVDALEKGRRDPHRLVTRWKQLHETGETLQIDGSVFDAAQLTLTFFRRIVRSTFHRFRAYPSVVVIAHPSHWGERPVGSLRRALTDLETNVTTCSAAEAACLQYSASSRIGRDGYIAVYDVGASCVDVSLVEQHGRTFALRGSATGSGPHPQQGFCGLRLDEYLTDAAMEGFHRLFKDKLPIPLTPELELRLNDSLERSQTAARSSADAPVVGFPGLPDYQVPLQLTPVVQFIREGVRTAFVTAEKALEAELKDYPPPRQFILLGGTSELRRREGDVGRESPAS